MPRHRSSYSPRVRRCRRHEHRCGGRVDRVEGGFVTFYQPSLTSQPAEVICSWPIGSPRFRVTSPGSQVIGLESGNRGGPRPAIGSVLPASPDAAATTSKCGPFAHG
jgi:hypothetical protein